jgi:hypothetical protein
MLSELFYENINNPQINLPCPYGDGRASEKITEILQTLEKALTKLSFYQILQPRYNVHPHVRYLKIIEFFGKLFYALSD